MDPIKQRLAEQEKAANANIGPNDEVTEVKIDGDKVIQFIRAVQRMGKILEEVNIIDVKEAFLLGKKVQCVDRVIEQDRQWTRCISEISDALKTQTKILVESKNFTRENVAVLKQFHGTLCSPESKEATDRINQLVCLLDRLEAHRKSGLLEAVTKLS